jgi:surface antigen
MMKKTISALLLIVFGIGLAGCANPNSSVTKQDVGVISGGVIGGLLGSRFGGGAGQVAAIGAGTLAGAFIGGAIGRNMDDTDRMKMSHSLETNPVGKPAYWQNERTGNTYTVTPVRNVSMDGNPYCREYRTVANIGGKTQQVYGTACRQPDGAWKVVDSQ